MNLNKILGYFLLISGLLLIVFILYQSYDIFMGKILPPLVFKIQVTKKIQNGIAQNVQQQVNEVIKQQVAGILPMEDINKFLNLVCWSIFSGIFIVGGGQMAGLGIKLIKN